MSVFIVRAFIRLRDIALTNAKPAHKLAELEKRVSDHDEILIDVIREIRKLIDTPKRKGKNRIIGFLIPAKAEKLE
jgi:hypothetical protein